MKKNTGSENKFLFDTFIEHHKRMEELLKEKDRINEEHKDYVESFIEGKVKPLFERDGYHFDKYLIYHDENMLEFRLMVDKKESLETVKNNEGVFLDFIDYLFPYLDVETQVNVLERYKEWLNGK